MTMTVREKIAHAVATEGCPTCEVEAGTPCEGTVSGSGTHLLRVRASLDRDPSALRDIAGRELNVGDEVCVAGDPANQGRVTGIPTSGSVYDAGCVYVKWDVGVYDCVEVAADLEVI